MSKYLLLLILFSMGILGSLRKNREGLEWQCPSSLEKCPRGCVKQEEAKWECSNKIFYEGPGKCAKRCPWVCGSKESCVKDKCCAGCGVSVVPSECGILATMS